MLFVPLYAQMHWNVAYALSRLLSCLQKRCTVLPICTDCCVCPMQFAIRFSKAFHFVFNLDRMLRMPYYVCYSVFKSVVLCCQFERNAVYALCRVLFGFQKRSILFPIWIEFRVCLMPFAIRSSKALNCGSSSDRMLRIQDAVCYSVFIKFSSSPDGPRSR